jgi:hypothetical protein
MGMAPAAPTYWTAQMVRDLPNDGRPWHEILVERLMFELGAYAARPSVSCSAPGPTFPGARTPWCNRMSS